MFFDKIYQTWKPWQERKYSAVFRLLRKLSAKPLGIDIGSGAEKREYPFPFIRADISSGDIRADGRRLPFRDGQFRTAIMVDSAHLIGTEEAERILSDNGILVVALPPNLWRKVECEMEEIERVELEGWEKSEIRVFKK